MRENLKNADFTRFNAIKPRLLEVVDNMLAVDIAQLMAQISKEEALAIEKAGGEPVKQPEVQGNILIRPYTTFLGGAFDHEKESSTPFGFGRGEGFDKGADEQEWVVNNDRYKSDEQFSDLGPIDGKISGRIAKEHMLQSKLPNSVLGKIWKLSDIDKDGQLDSDEFALANYLINLKLEGHELPSELPKHLIPPSKKEIVESGLYPKLDN